MKLRTITGIISLISIVRPDWQELLLITKLNAFFNFDQNIFLVHSSTDFESLINTTGRCKYIPQSLYVFNRTNTSIEDELDTKTLIKIKNKNTFMIVVPEISHSESNLNLINRIKEIRPHKFGIKIGIFFRDLVSNDDLQMFFEWCWKYQIVNIFVAFHSQFSSTQGSDSELLLNIFNFNPFGSFNVLNITGSQSMGNFFLSQHSNFHHHPIRVAQPSSPEYVHSISREDRLLWNAVFDAMNATVRLVFDGNPQKVPTREWFANFSVDIVPELYDNQFRSINVYPVLMDLSTIVVPMPQPYSEFSSYLKTVTSDIFFGYSLITIVVVMLLLSFFRHIKYGKYSFVRSIIDVLNLLMNDNTEIKYQRLSRVEICLITPLTLVGLVVVNGILSTLQSYLTRPIFQPGITSIEDLYRSSFPIVTFKKSWIDRTVWALQNISIYRDWSEKIKFMDAGIYLPEIIRFNSTISFIMPLSGAKLLIEFQKRLNIRGFQMFKVTIHPYLNVYPVNGDFPFVERFNEIIGCLTNAGLLLKWREDGIREYIVNVYKKYNGNGSNQDSDINSFPVPTFIIYGWFVGTVVLIIEIIWKKMSILCLKEVKINDD